MKPDEEKERDVIVYDTILVDNNNQMLESKMSIQVSSQSQL